MSDVDASHPEPERFETVWAPELVDVVEMEHRMRFADREGWALVALTFGLATGPVGLAVGWWLVATSTLWTVRQKVLAALAVPAPLATGLGIVVYTVLNFTMEDDVGYAPPWEVAIVWIGFLSLFVVPFVLAFHLAKAAEARLSEGLDPAAPGSAPH